MVERRRHGTRGVLGRRGAVEATLVLASLRLAKRARSEQFFSVRHRHAIRLRRAGDAYRVDGSLHVDRRAERCSATACVAHVCRRSWRARHAKLNIFWIVVNTVGLNPSQARNGSGRAHRVVKCILIAEAAFKLHAVSLMTVRQRFSVQKRFAWVFRTRDAFHPDVAAVEALGKKQRLLSDEGIESGWHTSVVFGEFDTLSDAHALIELWRRVQLVVDDGRRRRVVIWCCC